MTVQVDHYQPHGYEPIDVRIVKTPEELTQLAVDFGVGVTFSVPLIGSTPNAPPVQILQRRPTRDKARIFLPTLVVSGNTQTQSLASSGSTTSPGPGTNLAGAGVTPPAGTYNVYINEALAGTLAQGTDDNNTKLVVGGATFTRLSNVIAPGQQNFGPFQVTVNGAQVITVQAVAAGTVGSIYSATLNVVPLNGATGAVSATGLVLATRPDYVSNANNPQGMIITQAMPGGFNWESQQPCYAAALGSGPVSVVVLDQNAAAPEAKAEEGRQEEDISFESEQEGGRDYGYPGTGNQY